MIRGWLAYTIIMSFLIGYNKVYSQASKIWADEAVLPWLSSEQNTTQRFALQFVCWLWFTKRHCVCVSAVTFCSVLSKHGPNACRVQNLQPAGFRTFNTHSLHFSLHVCEHLVSYLTACLTSWLYDFRWYKTYHLDERWCHRGPAC